MFFERKGQTILPAISSEIFTTQTRQKEDGHFEDELVGNVDVPDPRLFRLDYLLQNNVALEQVNTKILGGSFEDLGEDDSGIVIDGNSSNSVKQSTEE